MNVTLHFLLLIALLQGTPADPLKRASIEGTVHKLGSGDPVSEAGVELRLAGNSPARPFITVTTSEGKFAFKDIPAGEYRLAATHSGYIRSEYGQRGPNGQGLPIKLAAGEDLKDARIGLTETGTISGRIQNGAGEPIANVQVQALKFAYFNGRRGLVTVKGAVTNDLGEYRLYWLPPERYVIMATSLEVALPDTLVQVFSEDRTLTSSIPSPTGELIPSPDEDPPRPFYFPGTPDAQFASAVTVRSGENSRGVDMIIAAPAARRVRGRVTNLPAIDAAGVPDAISFVQLNPRNMGAFTNLAAPLGLHQANMKTGIFEIGGVLPGSYYVDATGDGLSTGRVSIDVGADDIDNVVIPLETWFDLPVQVRVDGGPGTVGNTELNRISIELIPAGVSGLVPEQIPQEAAGAGRFTLHGVAPFHYKISVRRLPESSYVKSIRLNGMNILDDEFALDRAPLDPIEIVLGLKAGVASGTVVTDKQMPIENVTAVLVPDSPRRQRWELYRNTTTDASGHFEITDIAPGDYKLFAWEDIPRDAWQDPDFISTFENRGKAIHIDEGSNEMSQLTVVPADAR